MSEITPVRYSKKIFFVEAIQVTPENLKQVATWCRGRVLETNDRPERNQPPVPFVKVPVDRPKTPRQTRAFVGDYVVKADNGLFRMYTRAAFELAFEPVGIDKKYITKP